MADKDILKDALAAFKLSQDAEADNRADALDDLRFARLGEQWPEEIKKKRDVEGRPCLTLNKLPAFIRQVVNDGRLNKPQIKVHPVDSSADPKTAEVINGLIRNIETVSNADVAYDTGLECAVTMGFGYWRVSMDYACDDSFDMDLSIQRISNPFSVYGDPHDRGADSSEWNSAFITDMLSKDEFQRRWKGAEKIDWKMGDYADIPLDWMTDEKVMIAEWWRREKVKKTIVLLSDGRVVTKKWLLGDIDGFRNLDIVLASGLTVVNERETNGYKVTQSIMSGVEVLETNDWPGIYIPIIAEFGEEVNIEGKRHLRSLIRDAKDPQRNFNYWRTASTELVALSPKMPFIGATGQFNTDSDKWATANTDTHAYIEYDIVNGAPPPMRQGFSGPPAGALQEALNASDDMKSVMGMYDASLGARSNETSGVAINARKREGDVSTFHFVDNQSRAIRHTGRVLLDLIPHVYNKARIIRVIGQDKKPQNVAINQPITDQNGQPMVSDDGIEQIYDLTVGKYDLTVDTGANFTTQREEASAGMTALMQALPQAAAVIAPHLAKAQDWPDAEKIAEELAALSPNANGQNPAIQQLQQQLQQQDAQAKDAIGQLQQQLQQKNQDAQQNSVDNALKAKELQIKEREVGIKEMEAKAKIIGDERDFQQEQASQQANQQMPDMEGEDDMNEIAKLERELMLKKEIRRMELETEMRIKMMETNAGKAPFNNPSISLDDEIEPQQNEAMTRLDEVMNSVIVLAKEISTLKQIMAAPTVLIRDENGRAAGSRKVIDDEQSNLVAQDQQTDEGY